MSKREFIRMTIVEPFPVLFSHVAYPTEARRDTAKGPHYAAGSESFHSTNHAAYVAFCADELRGRGWTVNVDQVER